VLLAALLAKPLWQVIPAYFIIGVIWALAYLPRSITLQARAYKAWRDKKTGGRPLREVLVVLDNQKKEGISPEAFLRWRDEQPFSERRILIGFIVNIAIWPLRVVEKLMFDILRSTFVWMFELLCDMWRALIVPFFRAIGRLLRAIGRAIRAVFRWFSEVLQATWDKLVVPVWRALRHCVRWLWFDMLVPLYTWVYHYVTTVYKSIIQRANREAIADLAALNKASTEGQTK
jgi:hypothetical protein